MNDRQVLNICIKGFYRGNWDFLKKATSNSLKRLKNGGYIKVNRDRELNCLVYTITPTGKELLKNLNELKMTELKQFLSKQSKSEVTA